MLLITSFTSKSHYLVEEIIGIVCDVDMCCCVAFINPAFAKNEQNEEGARTGSCGVGWLHTDEEFEVDDEQSASDQSEALVLECNFTAALKALIICCRV